MTVQNPWFLLALFGVLVVFHLKLLAEWLNLARFTDEVPPVLQDILTREDRVKARGYHAASAKIAVMQDSVQLAALLLVWWSGGFGLIQAEIQALGWTPVLSGIATLGCLAHASSLLSLPFEAWQTFGVEAEFGLNQTSIGTFIQDRVKGLLLMAVIGAPMATLILWLLQNVANAALWAWLTVSLFGLLMSWLSPRFVLPLFFKFSPLPEGSLRTGILQMAADLDFPVQEIYLADGSRRSTRANAFLAGFGNARRIALFDTLIQTHSEREILAVLAHEIGHAKCGHLPKMMLSGLLQSALLFGTLHFALLDPRLYSAFGVQAGDFAMGLVLFSIVWSPLSLLIDMLHGRLSRRFEFEADAFSKSTLGDGLPMITALKQLAKGHLAHLTPHPFHVALHDSHPPILERLHALAAE
jgi:STE24 endopeptidase